MAGVDGYLGWEGHGGGQGRFSPGLQTWPVLQDEEDLFWSLSVMGGAKTIPGPAEAISVEDHNYSGYSKCSYVSGQHRDQMSDRRSGKRERQGLDQEGLYKLRNVGFILNWATH